MTTTNQSPKRPAGEPKFQVGDAVTFTNEYGVVFPGKTVTGIEVWESQPDVYRYFFSPTDTPWYSTRESLLAKAVASPAA